MKVDKNTITKIFWSIYKHCTNSFYAQNAKIQSGMFRNIKTVNTITYQKVFFSQKILVKNIAAFAQ